MMNAVKINAMRFVLSLLVLFSLESLVGCSANSRDRYPEAGIQVRIPFWSGSQYEMRVVELESVEDVNELRGGAAKFLMNPRVEGNQLVGVPPQIRTMRNSDGVYVATDTASLELLTIYYHFEQLAKIDEKLGIKSLNQWPRKIAIVPNLFDAKSRKVENNALYSGIYDALMFTRFEGADLPITVNAGVLAHEHFHSIFQRLVLDKMERQVSSPKPEDEKADSKMTTAVQRYHDFLIRSLNEGLADYWGWLYTGDENFISKSLPAAGRSRVVSRDLVSVLSKSCYLKASSIWRNADVEIGYSYDLGTRLSRWFRALSEQQQKSQGWSREKTQDIMKEVLIKSLSTFKKEISSAQVQVEGLETTQFMNIVLYHLPSVSAETRQWSNQLKETRCHLR